MQINSFEEAMKLAEEFFTTKERKNHYGFTSYNDLTNGEVVIYNILEDEEVAKLRVLKEKYGEEFVKHLDEVFDDQDRIDEFSWGQELLGIDLDHISYFYKFMIHELKPDGTVSSRQAWVELNDKEYTTLLARQLYDKHFNMNLLRICDNDLYGTIMRATDNRFRDLENDTMCMDNPYAVTMDEVKADVETIIKAHGIEQNEGYLCGY